MSRSSRIHVALDSDQASFAWPNTGLLTIPETWKLLNDELHEAEKLVSIYPRIREVVLDEDARTVTLALPPERAQASRKRARSQALQAEEYEEDDDDDKTDTDERPSKQQRTSPGGRAASKGKDGSSTGSDRTVKDPIQQRAYCLKHAYDDLLIIHRGAGSKKAYHPYRRCKDNANAYALSAWTYSISQQNSPLLRSLINQEDLDACSVESSTRDVGLLDEAEHALSQLVHKLRVVLHNQNAEFYNTEQKRIDEAYSTTTKL